MASDAKIAAISCPVCFGEYQSRLKVLSCGHVLCEGCLGNLEKMREQKGKCPYCKTGYKKDVYTLFPDLAVVNPTSSPNEVLERTRQRVIHVINPLGVMSSADQIRDAYNSAREHRAFIRNTATGSKNPDFETLTLAVTDAVDSLEERLHYSLQKQDLANTIIDMKRKLKTSSASHEVEKAALKAEVGQLKLKFRHEEKERSKAAAALDTYKERYNTVVTEKSALAKQLLEQTIQGQAVQKQLEVTKAERGTFQGQLEEYKKKSLKQRAVIAQLRQEIEGLKAKAVQKPSKELPKPRPSKPSGPSFPINTWPFVPPVEASRVPIPEYIDLGSSSPAGSHYASPRPGASRKRHRRSDENSSDVMLLSPPKYRPNGLSRPKNEVLETVTARSMGRDQRSSGTAKYKPVHSFAPRHAIPPGPSRPITAPSFKHAAPPTLSLNDGKLLGVVKRRKIRAL
ncbi:hypothetical protein M408DRAFT_25812 [Serendipita vermifera MAFF 305830]|uniref:RING-type domain-containing protein n=1 Tax=Serendipita vermifera MAFF 305830 TaxID=933852 RepID=A0A0C3B136_SERVB|nr:hypothetical protein M408DRAFT_25812 [Serendipita vermifera MAFF 305830]